MFKWFFSAWVHQAEEEHSSVCSPALEKITSINERNCSYFIYLFLQKQHFNYTYCEGIWIIFTYTL